MGFLALGLAWFRLQISHCDVHRVSLVRWKVADMSYNMRPYEFSVELEVIICWKTSCILDEKDKYSKQGIFCLILILWQHRDAEKGSFEA